MALLRALQTMANPLLTTTTTARRPQCGLSNFARCCHRLLAVNLKFAQDMLHLVTAISRRTPVRCTHKSSLLGVH